MDIGKNIVIEIPGGSVILLTIAFVVLKTLGYINWSWLWVFSPLWISALLTVAILSFVGRFISKANKEE